MKNYKTKKEELRQRAINWQYAQSEHDFDLMTLSKVSFYFMQQGKKYGLIKEFKENAII